MLEALIDLEAGASVLKAKKSQEVMDTGPIEHPIDTQYKQLNCRMQPVLPHSTEWDLIDRAIQMTHASTHDEYTLSIESILRVDRGNEAQLFKPYEHLQRRLLWHGSRITNFAGIIGQGLRIGKVFQVLNGYLS